MEGYPVVKSESMSFAVEGIGEERQTVVWEQL